MVNILLVLQVYELHRSEIVTELLCDLLLSPLNIVLEILSCLCMCLCFVSVDFIVGIYYTAIYFSYYSLFQLKGKIPPVYMAVLFVWCKPRRTKICWALGSVNPSPRGKTKLLNSDSLQAVLIPGEFQCVTCLTVFGSQID